MTRILRTNYLLLIASLVLNSCDVKPRTFTVVPPPILPTPVTPGPFDAIFRTATPTFAPITPEPTVTPLFRAAEIRSTDYGQHLIVFVGDTFLLFRLPSDHSPLILDNENVLMATSDKNASPVMLQAVGIGDTRVSSWITISCANSPVGCQPPLNYTYVSVTVVDH